MQYIKIKKLSEILERARGSESCLTAGSPQVANPDSAAPISKKAPWDQTPNRPSRS
jgi:hypothetical protein